MRIKFLKQNSKLTLVARQKLIAKMAETNGFYMVQGR